MWSLGVSAGKPGAGGGTVPGPGFRGQGVRGTRRVRSGAGGWEPVKKDQRLEESSPGCHNVGFHCSSLQTGAHPHVTLPIPVSKPIGAIVHMSQMSSYLYLTALGCHLLQGITLCKQEALRLDNLAPSCCKQKHIPSFRA